MENPKSHSKTKLKWKMCIGIALLAVISCCCLAVYGYFKFFPALALMFFPSHILTASTRTPTDPRMTPGVPTEVRTMLPADLLEQKTGIPIWLYKRCGTVTSLLMNSQYS